MCEIVAMYSRRDPISVPALERASKSLYHRGPDGQRHWIAPDSRIALGHARLSIIDLTTGDQPIASEDEKIHIVVNGEFYGDFALFSATSMFVASSPAEIRSISHSTRGRKPDCPPIS